MGICLSSSETPEGQAVGVVKNLSMNCEITTSLTSETALFYIKEYIKDFDEIDIYTFNKISMCKALINGNWIGFTDKPKELISEYKNDIVDKVL